MKNYILLLSVFVMLSCSSNDNVVNENNDPNQFTEWNIPIGEVRDGGPGKDGIPSIDNPQFVNVSEVNFLSDEDLVVGIVQDGEARAYPHII